MSRKITIKARKFIDDALKNNGLAQQAIKNKDARLLFRLAAAACVGIREEGGNNKGPIVQEFQKTCDGLASKEAWCMAYVQTIIAYVEVTLGVTSPIPVSEHCMTVFSKTSVKYKVKKIPAPGAICIWNYVPGVSGHTGILDQYRVDAKKMNLYEGNTTSGLTAKGVIERDGGGVYYTERSTVGSKKMVIKGFLIPF